MGHLVSLVVLAFDIVAIVKILQTNDEGLKKALWIALVLILPFLGLLLWYFLGRKAG